ncbi:PIN domain-containing protein [Gaiella sp.]|uniref:PIN domain-containing protein n=1 Tax=Gaiella sp. TaxID=2663207 RepID=UPI002E330CD6|nr:PIN domain-containing protein [Gaiella sp.]HEX5582850.1 PIN domain-containing protein [Gaiella sp.]
MLPSAVVVDANVVLSALIGGRARLVIASPLGPSCLAAQAVADEVTEHLPALAERRGLDASLLLAALSVMPVEWQAKEVYEVERGEAERRMAGRDPEDWPTVALALVRSLPIWSQDKDMEASGVSVYTTGELLDAMREAGDPGG